MYMYTHLRTHAYSHIHNTHARAHVVHIRTRGGRVYTLNVGGSGRIKTYVRLQDGNVVHGGYAAPFPMNLRLYVPPPPPFPPSPSPPTTTHHLLPNMHARRRTEHMRAHMHTRTHKHTSEQHCPLCLHGTF